MAVRLFPGENGDLGKIQRQQSYLAKVAINNSHMASTSPSTSISSPRLSPPVLDPIEQTANTHVLPEPALSNDTFSHQPPYETLHHALTCLPASRLFPGVHHETPYARSISSTAPGSPRISQSRSNTGTPRRPHATTLNIPGLTKSRVSPDGRIPDRDVGSKLVIIMVGLPARGKSYITKKLKRYISWQQHRCKVFNVGNRRRVEIKDVKENAPQPHQQDMSPTHRVARILLNGNRIPDEPSALDLNRTTTKTHRSKEMHAAQVQWLNNGGQTIELTNDRNNANEDKSRKQSNPSTSSVTVSSADQSASFFDPKNEEGAKMRERFALESLDELLDYLLLWGGAVGILDATNSTLVRRKALVQRINEREPALPILFVESICSDPELLEANMRLKLSGPDYKGKDPEKSLADFKARVKAYESAYEPIGDYEEANNYQYIKLIDVGKKIVTHRLRGFLSDGVAAYLQTFNLSSRQIWITRHGMSWDNLEWKLGGDAELTPRGILYSAVLYSFIKQKSQEWLQEQLTKTAQASFPPRPGDKTPPYPELLYKGLEDKNFCVWTSMLKRSVQTAKFFENDDTFDVKGWDCFNEMYHGKFEGMTMEQIANEEPNEYKKRQEDKLHYVYPGVGGEGYLNVIGRLREMIREIERVTDHVCIISHRSVCRVLMAYFMGLEPNEIIELDIPLGMIFSIEPKPYGIEFHAYKYNEEAGTFDEASDYQVRKMSH